MERPGAGRGPVQGDGPGRAALLDKVKNLPDMSGVYLFKDRKGTVIYVGKAVSLRNRVRSYFQPGQAYTRRYQALPESIADLEFITVSSEVEALILESNLIKKYQPRYNIKLKDDKHYPYIRITFEDEWPRAVIARSMKKDGSRYFGPYTRSQPVRATLKVMQRVFGYRTCADETLKAAKRPCLNYHIGRCLGPCVGLVDRETYSAMVHDMCAVLEGRGAAVVGRLKSRMERAADMLDFETAARLRDQIRALEEIGEKQSIVLPDMKDRDVVGLAVEGNDAAVQVFQIRDGKMLGRETFGLSEAGGAGLPEIVESFLKLYYPSAAAIPPEIVLPARPGDEGSSPSGSGGSIEEWLSSLKGRRVSLRVPSRGRLRDLVNMASTNAKLALEEARPAETREAEATRAALDDLAKATGLPSRPHRMECYDISNIQGRQPVGSMVVFVDGRPAKDQYRRFRIKSKETPDDFAMMQEMLLRRFRRGLAEREEADGAGHRSSFAEFPDLIVIDGGKGQLNAALEVLDHLGLGALRAVGLAKQEEEIFRPGESGSVRLPKDSQALFLIQRLRDEAHRFAIGYHRKLRGKAGLKSILDEIPGIGDKRRSALLKRFGSARAIAEATAEEIAAVEGIGPALALKIKEALSI